MSHYIIGTAGHIDHGKTSLTKSLTHIDTDRLQEEKERSISIELGFAPFTLPSGQRVSIIDVPGHERFIRHMVAGVGGIDLVLLIVAADEGVMPQTTEHLHILDLLGISKGIIVLTKADLVEEDFLELVREDVRDAVQNTFLADAPICETSVVTQKGIEKLKQEIEHSLATVTARSSDRPFQLPVDRVFTIKGAGTVITGTVYSGAVTIGDEIEVLPEQLKARIRQIQVHGDEVETAFAGQRAALNVTQVKKEQLYRGQVLAALGQWAPTTRIDAYVNWLPNAPSIKHQAEMKVYVGSTESDADIILYDRPTLTGGESAYVSLRLHDPIVVSRGDRFIVRRPSPATTLGGGEVIHPYAKKLKYRPESALHLERMHKSDLSDRILDTLAQGPLIRHVTDLTQALTESEQPVKQALMKMVSEQEVIEVLPSFFSLNEKLSAKLDESVRWLEHYHEQYPLRPGPTKAEWAARFLPDMPNKTIDALLNLWRHQLKTVGENIATETFEPFIPVHLHEQAQNLLQTVEQQGLAADSWESLARSHKLDPLTSADLLSFYENNGAVVTTEDGRAISVAAFNKAKQQIVNLLQQQEQLTMQDAKALFGLSRKYMVPLLEQMDRVGITRREGNVRYLA